MGIYRMSVLNFSQIEPPFDPFHAFDEAIDPSGLFCELDVDLGYFRVDLRHSPFQGATRCLISRTSSRVSSTARRI